MCVVSYEVNHWYLVPDISERTGNVFFSWWKKSSAERGLSQLYAERHTASDTVGSALLMGGRRGSVDVVVVAPGRSRSVGRVLGNRHVEGRRCSFVRLHNRGNGNVSIDSRGTRYVPGTLVPGTTVTGSTAVHIYMWAHSSNSSSTLYTSASCIPRIPRS